MCLRIGTAPQEKSSRTQSDLDTLRVVEVESSELLDNGRQSDGGAPILVVQDGHRDASCDGICTRADANSNSYPEPLTAPSGRAVCLNGGIALQLSLAVQGAHASLQHIRAGRVVMCEGRPPSCPDRCS